MPNQFFTYQHSKIHFSKEGNGANILLTFHGFGQDHSVFSPTSQVIGNQYTVYSLDLFFHGKSEWAKDEHPLEKLYWKDLLHEFLNQEKIDVFSLLGFSIGGKFVLATLEAFPQRIQKIILLAPDGIKTSFWYSLATYPLMLRYIFRSMISKPDRFYTITRFAHSLKWIDNGVLRFAESQMNTIEKRNRVYFSWVVFRHFKFNVDAIAKLINSNEIQLTIVIGRYDKIITAKSMGRLVNRVKGANLEILEAGHNDIIAKWLLSVTKNQSGIRC